MRVVEEKLIRNPIDCKNLIKDNYKLIYEENRIQIKNIIKNFINNKDVELSILTRTETLKYHDNTIKVKIFNIQGSLERSFSVKLDNVKNIKIKELDETVLNQFKNRFSLINLLGINSKDDLKKRYRICQN